MSISVVGLFGVLLAQPPAFADYVPGMSCHEVGGFAEQVAEQKSIGVTLNEAVVGLRQSLGPEYRGAKRALEKIIRAIYSTKALSSATSDAIRDAYERACEVVAGR
jgi:hypothetical protein